MKNDGKGQSHLLSASESWWLFEQASAGYWGLLIAPVGSVHICDHLDIRGLQLKPAEKRWRTVQLTEGFCY